MEHMVLLLFGLVVIMTLNWDAVKVSACRKPDSSSCGPRGDGVGCSWGWNFRKRRSLTTNSDTSAIMKICDKDKDGIVSKDEYRRCFFLPAKTANEDYNKLNTDGVHGLSTKEIDQIILGSKNSANCYNDMLMRCGMRFLMFSRARDANETTACEAMQDYIECSSEYFDTCDLSMMTSFKHAMKDMFISEKVDGVCPDLDTSKLGTGTPYETLPCSKQAIVECDLMLLEDIHDGQDACESLKMHEECLNEMTETCDDDPARYARAGSHALVSAYMGNNICK